MTANVEPDQDSVSAINFPVTGMTCAACQARVQRALTAEPGVLNASVNLVTRSAAVRYDPSTVSPARLIAAVRATGYDAELPTGTEDILAESGDASPEIREARSLALRASVSVLAGIVAMALSMGGMGSTLVNYSLLGLTSVIHGLRFYLLRGGDHRSEPVRQKWDGAGRLLRSGDLHHRPGAGWARD